METRRITVGEKEFPNGLKDLKNAPDAIFMRGAYSNERSKVAIVGARAATNYGISMAEYFAETLVSEADIISTMNAGIGAAAIRGASRAILTTKAAGKVFAVLGCGADICYPKENQTLYDWCMSPDHGAVISPYADGTPPLTVHHIVREELIAAMADVVLVVEAREKSGTLVIVDMALELGKTVMVIPGRITDPLSRGCNELIKSGAMIATCPQDVLDAINEANS